VITINPQTIKSPSGEELIILPKAEFDALILAASDGIEDDDDVAVFDTRMADLKAGFDARLPSEVSAAMLRGDTLIRALRRWKDVTQLQIAYKTTLTQGYISDLESGRKAGTPETLRQIAEALDVDPSWLGVPSRYDMIKKAIIERLPNDVELRDLIENNRSAPYILRVDTSRKLKRDGCDAIIRATQQYMNNTSLHLDFSMEA
jgi:transcriptional regulator with XRE-family HTH domain